MGGNSGWRGLDDTRLDRLFENKRTFRRELEGELLNEATEQSSWISDFEGHHLRVAEVLALEGRVFAVYLDGEPVGELEELPANWKIDALS